METKASNLILVVGATGGVGQLTVARLLETTNFKVRVLTRNSELTKKMFDDQVEIVVGDIRYPETLSEVMANINYLICCTGTTALPSTRWEFEVDYNLLEWLKIYFDSSYRNSKAKNSPHLLDAQGVSNLVAATPKDLKRFVLVSSCGVLRSSQFPFSVLNKFGVLDAKRKGEEALINSQLPYTIIRPGRLIDGPYTSYDLNTLIKAKTNSKLGVVLGTGDILNGQASRIDVAAACVESILHPITEGKIFEIVNQGNRPPKIDWSQLFSLIASFVTT